MKKTFDDFTTQIQSDELAAKSADGKFSDVGGDWVNDFDDIVNDDDGDIIND